MGIFDNLRNGIEQVRAQNQAANNFATGMSFYAPEFTNYQSQLAGQAAAAAAQSREYAARSSALFDDAAIRKGQLALDNAGIGISREANNRQASILVQLQDLANQRYANNANYMNSTRGYIDRNRDIDVANILRDATTAQRAAVSDAVGRSAVVSAGHRADMSDIDQKVAWDRAGVQVGYEKSLAELQNRLDNASFDYQADAKNRSNEFAGIGDANRRLDLDLMNNALMAGAADRNAGTQAAVLAAQRAAMEAQAKAAQDAINLQRLSLARQIQAASDPANRR